MSAPILPMIGDDLDSDIVLASLWSTDEPDEFGAYTCHLMVLDNSCRFRVGLWSWSEKYEGWYPDDESIFGSAVQAARYWTELTE